MVTAIAALLRSYFPYLKAAQIRALLMETVRPMDDGRSISGGTVDMLRAVERLLSAENWYRAEAVSEKNVHTFHLSRVRPSSVISRVAGSIWLMAERARPRRTTRL